MDSPPDETSETVKTRVPAYQKAEWKSHAEELGMSQSEFVRCMVQAARRGFDDDLLGDDPEPSNPGGSKLETRVQELLLEIPMDFDELLNALKTDLETELDETLDRLKDEEKLTQRPRGEFILDESELIRNVE